MSAFDPALHEAAVVRRPQEAVTIDHEAAAAESLVHDTLAAPALPDRMVDVGMEMGE